MDPDATLAELRRRVSEYLHRSHTALGRIDDTDCDLIAELFDALDHWLVQGGYMPDAWRNTR